MLGPKLARLSADDFARRAVSCWAKSLAMGAELAPEERALAVEMEAVFEVMYLMAAADGELGKDELLLLSQSLEAIITASESAGGSRFELGLPLLKLGEILGRFGSALSADGLKARVASVAERLGSESSRRLALSLAAGVAFVDDFVADGEMRALDRLARALGFDHEDALRVLREAHGALS
ncbi:MAG: hypothetical protein AMXMBFR56_21050 [Polyangiaceae bacterium]